MKSIHFLAVGVLLTFAQLSVAANEDSCNSSPEQLVACVLDIARNWPTMSIEQIEKAFSLELSPKRDTIPNWTYQLVASNSDIQVVVALPGLAPLSYSPLVLFDVTVLRRGTEGLCITQEIIQRIFGPPHQLEDVSSIPRYNMAAVSRETERSLMSMQLPRRRQIDYIVRGSSDEKVRAAVTFRFPNLEEQCSTGISLRSTRRP
jgi:hypothetical protein